MDVLASIRPLGSLRPGESGRIVALTVTGNEPELEERLLRMGFAEDARIQVRHEGPVGRDPMAVMVDGIIVALRRREADTIMIEIDTAP